MGIFMLHAVWYMPISILDYIRFGFELVCQKMFEMKKI
jgi:hypothetical protein